ncbi:hypothetical protein LEMLEM_LOCUS21320, partial [Lemmus lemmus]
SFDPPGAVAPFHQKVRCLGFFSSFSFLFFFLVNPVSFSQNDMNLHPETCEMTTIHLQTLLIKAGVTLDCAKLTRTKTKGKWSIKREEPGQIAVPAGCTVQKNPKLRAPFSSAYRHKFGSCQLLTPPDVSPREDE